MAVVIWFDWNMASSGACGIWREVVERNKEIYFILLSPGPGCVSFRVKVGLQDYNRTLGGGMEAYADAAC